ncbi:acetyl-CoA carboxylase biotin carboxyl carrier protein subunit [Patescibacteria group bacterium]|nr:acetyl-CoA carboxylase biotin carboxyl carrier protein subunit [Patescibacteria group bacterium]MBU4481600.1 acetyl-CoA carboxylase biotin carboxyl carrier protein subunit [Patescibacteria group bacterium]
MKIKIREKVYGVKISEVGGGRVKIIVDGKEFIFKEKGEEKISVAQVSLPKRDFSKKEIKALIAGRISEIFVKEGEFVKKDQKLLLLSSMKMENEIIADFEGKVKEILIKKDQEAIAGQTLIILI